MDEKLYLEEDILEICREAITQVSDNNKEITLQTEITTEEGIDSLALMNIIIALEEQFNIVLDDKLIEIRDAKRVLDLVNIVKVYCQEN